MTKVTIEKRGKSIVKVTCDGHTNYGEKGEDIVCAALSSIVQTAALGMLGVAGANITINRDDKKGFFEIIIPEGLSESVSHDVQIIFATMMCGLSDLHSQYSDFIEMEVQNVL